MTKLVLKRSFLPLFSIVLAASLAVAQTPKIKSVSKISAQQYQTIVITGSGFGTQQPYTGDSNYILLADVTKGWNAGNAPEGNLVTLIVNSWADSQITLGGFSGDWGDENWTLDVGDEESVSVWNAQSGDGPAIKNTTVVAAEPTEAVLYSFTGGSDGGYYVSSPISDNKGNFYGTTAYGGANGQGTVFELSPSGSGGWNETVLYSFCSAPNCADGAYPVSSLIFDSGGNLYGTTYNGGGYGCDYFGYGCGVVFELSPVGSSWTETVLYSFHNDGDGAEPSTGLIMDPAGNLYGSTCGVCNAGVGTVFELRSSGGVWTEYTIYTVETTEFAGLTMDAAGNIFGNGYSTVFELSPCGTDCWNPTVIHTFAGGPKDGSVPEGTLALDKSGNLYGTTVDGGLYNVGTVYKLTPGKKGWKEKILYSPGTHPKDGSYPYAGIVFDASGDIYGTTQVGGKYAAGTVFELVANGKGGYKEKDLWSFNGTDGGLPEGSLILDGAGDLYGAAGGGSSGAGVVFEVTP